MSQLQQRDRERDLKGLQGLRERRMVNYCDRTSEFLAIARGSGGALGTTHTTQLSTLNDISSAKMPQSRSEFTKAAAQISKGIAETSEKLSQLAQRARKRSPFDGESNKIGNASLIIKTNLQRLNKDLEILDTYVTNQRNRNRGEQQSQHSTAVLNNLRSQLAKTTQGFSSALTTRTKTMAEQSTRRKAFEASNTRRPKRDLHAFEGMMGGQNTEQEGDQQDQVLIQVNDNVDYFQQRNDDVDDIQSLITELSGMYSKLSNVLQLQEEDVMAIDTNVGNALVNISLGEKELQRNLDRQRSSQWLIIKVFGVLLTFAMFFVMFVA